MKEINSWHEIYWFFKDNQMSPNEIGDYFDKLDRKRDWISLRSCMEASLRELEQVKPLIEFRVWLAKEDDRLIHEKDHLDYCKKIDTQLEILNYAIQEKRKEEMDGE